MNSKRSRILSSAAIVSVLITAMIRVPAVSAQSFTGGLRGAVKDTNGVIPGVDVTLVNEGTSAARSTTTNAVGEYSFPALTAGTYTVKVALQGFKSFERPGIARSSSSRSTSCSRLGPSRRRSTSRGPRR